MVNKKAKNSKKLNNNLDKQLDNILDKFILRTNSEQSSKSSGTTSPIFIEPKKHNKKYFCSKEDSSITSASDIAQKEDADLFFFDLAGNRRNGLLSHSTVTNGEQHKNSPVRANVVDLIDSDFEISWKHDNEALQNGSGHITSKKRNKNLSTKESIELMSNESLLSEKRDEELFFINMSGTQRNNINRHIHFEEDTVVDMVDSDLELTYLKTDKQKVLNSELSKKKKTKKKYSLEKQSSQGRQGNLKSDMLVSKNREPKKYPAYSGKSHHLLSEEQFLKKDKKKKRPKDNRDKNGNTEDIDHYIADTLEHNLGGGKLSSEIKKEDTNTGKKTTYNHFGKTIEKCGNKNKKKNFNLVEKRIICEQIHGINGDFAITKNNENKGKVKSKKKKLKNKSLEIVYSSEVNPELTDNMRDSEHIYLATEKISKNKENKSDQNSEIIKKTESIDLENGKDEGKPSKKKKNKSKTTENNISGESPEIIYSCEVNPDLTNNNKKKKNKSDKNSEITRKTESVSESVIDNLENGKYIYIDEGKSPKKKKNKNKSTENNDISGESLEIVYSSVVNPELTNNLRDSEHIYLATEKMSKKKKSKLNKNSEITRKTESVNESVIDNLENGKYIYIDEGKSPKKKKNKNKSTENNDVSGSGESLEIVCSSEGNPELTNNLRDSEHIYLGTGKMLKKKKNKSEKNSKITKKTEFVKDSVIDKLENGKYIDIGEGTSPKKKKKECKSSENSDLSGKTEYIKNDFSETLKIKDFYLDGKSAKKKKKGNSTGNGEMIEKIEPSRKSIPITYQTFTEALLLREDKNSQNSTKSINKSFSKTENKHSSSDVTNNKKKGEVSQNNNSPSCSSYSSQNDSTLFKNSKKKTSLNKSSISQERLSESSKSDDSVENNSFIDIINSITETNSYSGQNMNNSQKGFSKICKNEEDLDCSFDDLITRILEDKKDELKRNKNKIIEKYECDFNREDLITEARKKLNYTKNSKHIKEKYEYDEELISEVPKELDISKKSKNIKEKYECDEIDIEYNQIHDYHVSKIIQENSEEGVESIENVKSFFVDSTSKEITNQSLQIDKQDRNAIRKKSTREQASNNDKDFNEKSYKDKDKKNSNNSNNIEIGIKRKRSVIYNELDLDCLSDSDDSKKTKLSVDDIYSDEDTTMNKKTDDKFKNRRKKTKRSSSSTEQDSDSEITLNRSEASDSLTEDEKSILKRLTINLPINYVIPPLHIIKRASKATQEELKQYQSLNVKYGAFSKQEDALIIQNWNTFCESHNLSLRPDAFFKFERGRSMAEKIKFLQYISQGLNDRMPYRVHYRFRKLFEKNKLKQGRYTALEDKVISDYMSKTRSSKPFHELAIILNRFSTSVERRYAFLISDRNKTPVKWDTFMAERMIKALMTIAKADNVKELKDFVLTQKQWKKLSGILDNIPVPKLQRAWKITIHPRLFMKENNKDVKVALIQMMIDNGEDDFRTISWEEYAKHFNGITSRKLSDIFRCAITYIPKKHKNDLKSILEYLSSHKNERNGWTKVKYKFKNEKLRCKKKKIVKNDTKQIV